VCLLVAQLPKPVERQPSVEGSRGEIAQRGRLVARKPDLAELDVGRSRDRRGWVPVADECLEAPEDRRRRARRDLLPNDRSRQRAEGVERPPRPPGREVDRLEAVDQASQRRIGGA